ncbi:ATP-binding protein [Streptomyces sp. NPDC054796]|uniref:ATP-binding protein n=1 Tax=Streptomyces daliensis TaxID=299421 RepID=A0A8T4IU47_9ACTN|nr:ATP-binding protein [Streptomyces daliensis]
MKQGTKKTLGVAALGAAFVATGSGVASADTAETVGAAAGAANQVAQALPLEEATESVPGNNGTVRTTKDTLGSASENMPGAVGEIVDATAKKDEGKLLDPVVEKLLGGLPVLGDLAKQGLGGLPTDKLTGGKSPVGLPVNTTLGS